MSTELIAQLRETNRIFEEAIAGGDFSALDRVYTQDARMMPPGAEMITGLPGIQSYWQKSAPALALTSAKLESLEVEFLGDTAIEIGRTNFGSANADAPTVVKYVCVWKKEGGAWKWQVDIWNPVS